MKKIIAGIFFGFSVLTANAGTGTGKIIGVIPFANGTEEILIINIENISSDTPACNTTKRFAMKISTQPNFKATQSFALAAMMAGTNVIVRGNNSCDSWGNAETFTFLCLGNTPC